MVQIDQIIAVGSKVGLFKLVASRSNGLILEDLLTHKTNFYSSRTFQFSPLESIGIYTLSDNIPLKDVYTRFLEKENELTPPDETATSADYKTYFETILPEYDRYRVHLKDMQKCLKWYYQLKALGFIKTDESLNDSSNESSAV